MAKGRPSSSGLRVAELFAGVGGFRIGLEKAGWSVVWSNQWEPGTRKQHASECYVANFGEEGHVCEDIAVVLDRLEAGELEIPDHELLVGGFPCQDYSVAKTLSQATGIEGKKGVLWWEIHRLLRQKKPPFALLENVDRLLKSPATQRGRDFAIILACLSDLGYEVEWRVVNAAEYGFPQKRRRVFIVASRAAASPAHESPEDTVFEKGVFARALPVVPAPEDELPLPGSGQAIVGNLAEVSASFGRGSRVSPFGRAGVMRERTFWSFHVVPHPDKEPELLRNVLEPEGRIPPEYFIPEEQLPAWRYLKNAKREERVKPSGFRYVYSEGAIPFPDDLDAPARTILTGEGGSTPSRFKHLIRTPGGRFRRLVPEELEKLNGFPPGWTATGMPDGRRAFMMGNALVVGIVERLGRVLREEALRTL